VRRGPGGRRRRPASRRTTHPATHPATWLRRDLRSLVAPRHRSPRPRLATRRGCGRHDGQFLRRLPARGAPLFVSGRGAPSAVVALDPTTRTISAVPVNHTGESELADAICGVWWPLVRAPRRRPRWQPAEDSVAVTANSSPVPFARRTPWVSWRGAPSAVWLSVPPSGRSQPFPSTTPVSRSWLTRSAESGGPSSRAPRNPSWQPAEDVVAAAANSSAGSFRDAPCWFRDGGAPAAGGGSRSHHPDDLSRSRQPLPWGGAWLLRSRESGGPSSRAPRRPRWQPAEDAVAVTADSSAGCLRAAHPVGLVARCALGGAGSRSHHPDDLSRSRQPHQ
jgi:hypothetical protein